jgi:hypothetical protein
MLEFRFLRRGGQGVIKRGCSTPAIRGLENLPFVMPGVEIKQATLYRVSTEQFWPGFLTPLQLA